MAEDDERGMKAMDVLRAFPNHGLGGSDGIGSAPSSRSLIPAVCTLVPSLSPESGKWTQKVDRSTWSERRPPEPIVGLRSP